MPPRASSRLRLFVLPGQGDVAAAAEVLTALSGVVSGAETWSGRERFFANGQGGFRVGCPYDGRSLTGPFRVAIEDWRAGGPRLLLCLCGEQHDLGDLRYEPPAGFAREALVVNDAPSGELSAPATAVLAQFWPGARVVGSRG
ncbi:MAG: hypothetical protein EXR71_11120 [Myxococcales bacterium]|nr:hypothetical protein [Myxococcales bacterium]